MGKITDDIRPLIFLQGISGLTGGGAANLDGLVTVEVNVPLKGWAEITGMGVAFYKLRAGTEVTSSPAIVRPADYAPGTNEKVWQLLFATGMGAAATLYTFGHGDPPTDGSITTQGYWDLDPGVHYINTAWPITAVPTWVAA